MRLNTTTHRRPRAEERRRTVCAHISEDAFAALDLLVKRGFFVNRSHAIDAAIGLLLNRFREDTERIVQEERR